MTEYDRRRRIMQNYEFQDWKQEVDAVIERLCGLRSDDLADQPWRDWFDSGLPAEDAARQALEDEGWSGS